MVNPTTPDDIPRWDSKSPASLVSVSQAIADVTQTALSKRERFDYVWANSTERDAQLGMVQGSRGYQVDTESEYVFEDANWEFSTAHVEYTFGTTSVPNNTWTAAGSLTFDAANSTSTTMTSTSSIPATGQVIFTNPGLYSYIATIGTSPSVVAMTGRTALQASYSHNEGSTDQILARSNIFEDEDRGTVFVPVVRILSSNDPIFLQIVHANGSSVGWAGRIRVTRIG